MNAMDKPNAVKLIFESSQEKVLLLPEVQTEPITHEQFEKWKQNYIDYSNSKQMSGEPIKVYFNKQQVLDALKALKKDTDTIAFMFDCNDSDSKNIRVLLCSMEEKDKLIPRTAVYESYPLGGRDNPPGDKSKYDKAKIRFKKRLDKFKDPTNWSGVAHEKPLILIRWLEESGFPRVVIYFGYVGHYTVMIAGSTSDYCDLVPTKPSNTDYKVYDNGTQCCRS